MNDALFSFCANIFGFVVGGISLLGFVVAVCRPHLPSNKIKTLETLLREAEDTFNEAVEAGLLVPEFVEKTEANLTGLKEQTYTLRARAYNVTTWGADYTEFLRGTSNAIGLACRSVKKLKAEVITSSEERRRLMQMGSEQTESPPSLPPNPITLHHSTPTPPALIPRPRSCPPALSVSTSDIVRHVPVENDESVDRGSINSVGRPDGSSPSDPFGGSSRSDSDVRTVDVYI